MENSGNPSASALTSAAARAAHLIVDGEPLIFSDTLAATFLGDRAGELLAYHRGNGSHGVLVGARTTVTTRSRYTEERLAEAVRRGVTQYLILGAGLDSFACRSPLARRVRVVEVDHPATQRWKRRLLTTHEILPPADVIIRPLGGAASAAGGTADEDGVRDDMDRRTADEGLGDPHRPEPLPRLEPALPRRRARSALGAGFSCGATRPAASR